MSDTICKPDEVPGLPTVPPLHPDWIVTPNYRLPIWRSNTVTSWLVQLNNAMLILDTVLHDFALRTSDTGEIPNELVTQVETNTDDIAEIKTSLCSTVENLKNVTEQLTNLSSTVANHTQNLNTLFINYNNIDTRMETAESAIDGLRQEVTKLNNNLNTLEQRVSALENTGGS